MALPSKRTPWRCTSSTRKFSNAAVDLPGGHCKGAEFGHVLNVAPAVAEEEAKTELLQLAVQQVVLQAQHLTQVMGADLDRRFTHLVRGCGHRMRAALEYQHVDAGQALPQLQRQRQAGQAAAHDHDVVHGAFVGHGLVHRGPWLRAGCR
jgi:hypothetical protein